MTQFIDRRQNNKNKSAVNRQRFMRRFKHIIKEAVSKAIEKRSITDVYKGEKVVIPKKDLSEPMFRYGIGGITERVYTGNKEFLLNDKIKRPTSSGLDSGSSASNTGIGEDDFVFELTKKEFIDLFFEDLELPDLVKSKLMEIKTKKPVKAGFSTVGTPPNVSIIRSLKNALGRRIAFSTPSKKKLESLEKELKSLLKKKEPNSEEILEVKKQIEILKKKIASIPFIDPFDFRYSNKVLRETPNTQAVMFCIMDVSGSMDEIKKDIAKRFFILLYLFLTKNYKNIHLVFIRHHTTAKLVDEHEFFYSRETGGTVVSSALELAREMIIEKYSPNDWNIYCAQASDGDNWNADSPRCQHLLLKDIMPYVQYYAYVEILPRHHQSLWRSYQLVKENFANFNMKTIHHTNEIYPVFRKLFQRKAHV